MRYVGDAPAESAQATDTALHGGGRKSYESVPLTPEELDRYREQRRQAAAEYMANPPKLVSGHNLELMVTGATIVGDEIRVSVLPMGQVQRPGVVAEVKTGQLSFVIPANVSREGSG